MKKITFTMLLLSLFSNAFAQSDTIAVSDQSTVYLTFEETVDLTNIGNKDFAQKVEGNIVMLKAVAPSTSVTTLLIRSGEFVGSYFLKYERQPSRTFYDFRRANRNIGGAGRIGSETKSENKIPDLKTTEDRAKKFLTHPTRFRSYGSRSGGVILSILDVVIDKKIMYVKLSVTNKSSADYNIDYISFQIKKGKGFINAVSTQTVSVEPVYGIAPEAVKASDTGVFVYALPMYAGSVGSDLVVTSRETDGGRTLSTGIPYTVINKANKY